MNHRMTFPQGWEETSFLCGPSFEHGTQILIDYCGCCAKENNCDAHDNLRVAMGMNCPYWAREFVALRDESAYPGRDKKVMCSEYEDKQLKLPGTTRPILDSVGRFFVVNS